MTYDVSEQERKLARHPHELFLVNLIFNHILLFVAALGVASSYPLMMLPIPLISAGTLAYILWKARKAAHPEGWFAMCHWQMAANRSRWFLIALAVVSLVMAGILLAAGGSPRPGHWAMLGAIILPSMVTILVLIVLESDAMHQARHGHLPKWVVERFPNPQAAAIQEPVSAVS